MSGSGRALRSLTIGAIGPAGQLWSTAADLARWAAFLADPSPDKRARARMVSAYDHDVTTDHWALGFRFDIVVRFAPYAGRYMYHCHILEHEDRDMMRPFVVTPPALMALMGMGARTRNT